MAILKAKIKSVISLEVGFLIVTIFKLFSSKVSLSLSCIRKPSDRSFIIWSEFITFFCGLIFNSLKFFLFEKILSAALEKLGAIITSRNILSIFSASSSLTSLLLATIPPKAL